MVASPCQSVLSFSGVIEEQRLLSYYLEKTAPALGGFFEVDFWCRLLPLVAASEESVQHALIAIAALHEETVTAKYSFVRHGELPVTLYNKAIRSITQQISLDGVNHKALLLTCVIFACIEFLRGMPELGLDHFQSGLNILIAHRASRKTVRDTPPGS